MKIKFWGTRGSLPRALSHSDFAKIMDDILVRAEKSGVATLEELRTFVKSGDKRLPYPFTFGGHTTCSEISHNGSHLFVDMGSGMNTASSGARPTDEFVIFLTHMHWDHIIGLPFFVPHLYSPMSRFVIYHVHQHAPEYVCNQFNGVNFPVKWEVIQSRIQFRKLNVYESVDIGDVRVTPFRLDHPGGCFGYRFEAGGRSLAIGVDGEYKRLTPQELGEDLRYYQNLDLLVFDSQYEMNELANRFDWGHCSPNIGVDLALREGIKTLVLSHHDPQSFETRQLRMLDDARTYLKTQLPAHHESMVKQGRTEGPHIVSAFDGLEIDLNDM